eukprot:238359_1
MDDEEEEEEEEETDHYDTMPPTPNFDDMKDFNDVFNIDGDDHEDYVDSCFNELMTELNSRRRDLHKINENEDIENILQNTKQRHSEMEQKLNELHYEYVDELPEMNKNWQDE